MRNICIIATERMDSIRKRIKKTEKYGRKFTIIGYVSSKISFPVAIDIFSHERVVCFMLSTFPRISGVGNIELILESTPVAILNTKEYKNIVLKMVHFFQFVSCKLSEKDLSQ